MITEKKKKRVGEWERGLRSRGGKENVESEKMRDGVGNVGFGIFIFIIIIIIFLQ